MRRQPASLGTPVTSLTRTPVAVGLEAPRDDLGRADALTEVRERARCPAAALALGRLAQRDVAGPEVHALERRRLVLNAVSRELGERAQVGHLLAMIRSIGANTRERSLGSM